MTISLGFNKNMTPKEATEKFVKAFHEHKFERARRLIETGLIDPNFDLKNVPRPKKSRTSRLMNLSGAVLMLAVELGEYDLAKALINVGADVNSGYTANYGTPLQRAVHHDDVRMTKLLLEAGASKGLKESLDIAILFGRDENVKELLSAAIKKQQAADLPKKLPPEVILEKPIAAKPETFQLPREVREAMIVLNGTKPTPRP